MIVSELSFGEIVKRGRLKPAKANYALKMKAHLPNMPESAGRGDHRVFDADQAVRLVLFCRLSEFGFRGSECGEIVKHFIKYSPKPAVIASQQDLSLEEVGILQLHIVNRTYAIVALIHDNKVHQKTPWLTLPGLEVIYMPDRESLNPSHDGVIESDRLVISISRLLSELGFVHWA